MFSEDDIFILPAAYLHGIIRNHPLIDGNKQTGYLAAFAFPYVNGCLIDADNARSLSSSPPSPPAK
ncbi:filamentation induced by cAMP/death on curing-related protein [Rhizobium gallicum bv. gallicum R602sp]|uniref:Filamentation induced by cAMP/death on curing-related protein n=1 Tax=Rhizobium gallicum bv. gallicum R602sp TaxID=1041138 RepID=A0A0B4X1W9_9HYPH|nr:Fic family protein [Rhizobium gallicum]AJD40745.1 filamentation induced by cAMP/death on curing-related protein [Rhizobium gallicum bv. gallicum R602sp]